MLRAIIFKSSNSAVEDLVFTVNCRQEETMTTTFTDLIAGIGGYLGLFVGFSCYGMIQQLIMVISKIGVKATEKSLLC